MADQEGFNPGGADASVAGVSAVLRLHIDQDTPLRQLNQFKERYRQEIREIADIAAKELGASGTNPIPRLSAAANAFTAERTRQVRELRDYLKEIKTLQGEILKVANDLGKPIRVISPRTTTGGTFSRTDLSSALSINDQVEKQQEDLRKQALKAKADADREIARMEREAEQRRKARLAKEKADAKELVDVLTKSYKARDKAEKDASDNLVRRVDATRKKQLSDEQTAARNTLVVAKQAARAKTDADKQWAADLKKINSLVEADNKKLAANQKARDKERAAEQKRSLKEMAAANKAALDDINRTSKQQAQGGTGLGTIAGGAFLGSFAAHAALGAVRKVTTEFNDLVGSVITFNAKIETASVGIRQFTKNGEQAQTLVNSLVKFAVTSPFGIDQVLDGAKRLLAMGVAADKVLPSLRTLSTAVAAVGGGTAIFNRVILAFGQISAKAKLSAQDLRQLTEAGIPAFKILQEELGLTSEEVFDIGNAAIDSRKGVEALLRGMEKRFGAGLILQMDTFTGRLRNLNDVWQLFSGRLGEGVNPQLKQVFKDLADILQDPGNLAAASAFGEVIGNLVKTIREDLFSDTGGLIAWIQGLPTTLSAAGIEITKFQNLIENFKGLDLNLEGKPILNFGSAPELNAEIDKLFAQVQKESDKHAREASEASKIQIGITAEIDIVRTELARNKVTGIEADNLIDLSGFSDSLSDEAEIQLTRGLTAGGAKSVENFLAFLDKALAADKDSGRAVGHIAAQLRETYVTELAALGNNPSVEKVRAASQRLVEALNIEGQFGESAIAKDVQKAAEAFFGLGQEQERLIGIQTSLQDLQAANKIASDKEQVGIETKTKAVKELTDARKAEAAAAELQLQPLRDEQFDVTREKRLRDIEFDKRLRDEQANTARLHSLLDPVAKSIELAHKQAATRLQDLETRQSSLSDTWKIINENQARIQRDLADSRSLAEEKYTKKIDLATAAEKRHAQIIKDTQQDQREKIRLQEEEIERIEEKYFAELQIKDLAVEEQDATLRAAQREQNKQDREFVKQIADAKKRGDKEAVEALKEQRQQARTNFDESQEEARAELQRRRDEAEAIRDTAEAEERKARLEKARLERTGQRTIAQLTEEGEKLTSNREKIEAERDVALGAYDRKIKIAEAFAELLGRTQADQENLANQEINQAKALETAAQRRLEAQQASDKLVFDGAEAREAAITNEKKAFDLAQDDKLEKLRTEIERLERIDELASRTADIRIAKAQEEVDKAADLHKANDLIRTADEARTKTLETETAKRITELDKETARLQGNLDILESYRKLAATVANENIPTTQGDIVAPNTRKQIQDVLNRQPNEDKRELQAAIVAAQREFERTGDQKAFNDIAGQILVLLGKAGLGSLTATDISDFLRRPEPKKILVNVDPAVIELLAAIQQAGKGSGVGLQRAGELLDEEGIIEKIVRAVAGTDTLAGSKAVLADLERLLPVLRSISPAAAESLIKLLGARGVKFDPATGKASVDEQIAQASATELGLAGTGLQDAATELKAAAAVLMAAGGGGKEDTATTLQKLLFPNKGPLSLDDMTGTIRSILSGEQSPLRRFGVDAIKVELEAALKDPTRRAALIEAINKDAATFRELFKQVVGSDTGVFGDLFFSDFEKELNKLIKQAEFIGPQLPKKLEGGIKDGSGTLPSTVDSNIVQPIGDKLKDIPVAGTNAVSSLLGEKGLGGLGSEASKEIVRTASTAASDALILAARKALGLDGEGSTNAFGQIASEATGERGLGAIASEKSLAAIDRAVKITSTALLASFRAGILREGDGGDTPTLSQLGTTSAQLYLQSFKQTLIDEAEATAKAGVDALAEALANTNIGVSVGTRAGQGGEGLLNPVKGALPVTNPFGAPGKMYGDKGHTGIDLNAPGDDRGSEIRAAADGVVTKVSFPVPGDHGGARENNGYGNMIVIDHLNEYSTLYAHLSGIKGPKVKVGQRVKRGQVIAYMGNTGNSFGSHLHLEVRKNSNGHSVALDPTPFLEGGSKSSTFQSTASDGSGGILDSTSAGRPTDKRSAAVQLIQGLIAGVEEAGGRFDIVWEAFIEGRKEIAEEKLKGLSKFAKEEMQIAFEALSAALEMLGGGSRQQIADALRAAGINLSDFSQGTGTAGLDLPELAGRQAIPQNVQNTLDLIRQAILSAPRTTEGERDPQIERLLNMLFDASPTALLSELMAEFTRSLPENAAMSPGLAALLEQIRQITKDESGIFAQDLQGLLFGKGEGFQQKQIEATESNTDALHLATLVIAESAGISAEQLQELRNQVKIWERLEAEWEQIGVNTGQTAANTGDAAETAKLHTTPLEETAKNTGSTAGSTEAVAGNTTPPVVEPLPLSEEMKKAIVDAFGQAFPENEALDKIGQNRFRGLIGFPEAGEFDPTKGLTETGEKPTELSEYEKAFGKLEEQAEIALTAEQIHEKARSTVIEALKEEYLIRKQLNDLLRGGPPTTPVSVPPTLPPGGTGPITPPGGSRPLGYGDRPINIFEAHNPQYTAAAVVHAQSVQERQYGDRYGRARR